MKKINLILLCAASLMIAFGFIKKNDSRTGVRQSGNAIGIEKGNLAPELKFTDPSGKVISLSSLKGSLVLLDFWASWCRPCRMENPNVVAAYSKYKSKKFRDAKGFAIYSVSLDSQKDAWVKAIQADHLDWPDHVSDLKGWSSEAAKAYDVTEIPTNFLIDSRGVIIAKSLHGQELGTELEKLLAK